MNEIEKRIFNDHRHLHCNSFIRVCHKCLLKFVLASHARVQITANQVIPSTAHRHVNRLLR